MLESIKKREKNKIGDAHQSENEEVPEDHQNQAS